MNYGKAFVAGVIGGLIMGILMLMARAAGMTGFGIAAFYGNLISSDLETISLALGMTVHLIISGFVGIIYAIGFVYFTGYANWLIGIFFGLVHWVVAGFSLGMMSRIHPPIESATLSSPGVFAANFGASAVALVLLAHIIFGAFVGIIYSQNAESFRTYGKGAEA